MDRSAPTGQPALVVDFIAFAPQDRGAGRVAISAFVLVK
jgi:hypothetical protein